MTNRSWRRVQPIPGASGHASTGGCAAGCCTCACCCPAAAQRASAGATSGAGCVTSGAGTRAGASWTWCSTAHVERAVRQRREQRRLLGGGVSNCASWKRPRLQARHQGVQGAPDQVAQRGKMESGEVGAAADDTGGSNMLLDLEVGRRVGQVEPVSPVICAKSRCTGLGRAVRKVRSAQLSPWKYQPPNS